MTAPFDANASGSDHGDDVVARMLEHDVDAQVDMFLTQARDWLAADADSVASEPVPDEVVARLEAITGADHAPVTFASLHRRVHEGRTSWQTFYADPRSEADGLRIMSAALAQATSELRQLREVRESERLDESEVAPDVRRPRAEAARAEIAEADGVPPTKG